MAIILEDLDFEQESLTSNISEEVFRENFHFDWICELLRKCGLTHENPKKSSLVLKLILKVKYFNHKSYGEEMLIERFCIEMIMEQLDPLSLQYCSVYSADIFNLNLTYGAFSSIYRALQEIKADEKRLESRVS